VVKSIGSPHSGTKEAAPQLPRKSRPPQLPPASRVPSILYRGRLPWHAATASGLLVNEEAWPKALCRSRLLHYTGEGCKEFLKLGSRGVL
jgi:hypothetical protein